MSETIKQRLVLRDKRSTTNKKGVYRDMSDTFFMPWHGVATVTASGSGADVTINMIGIVPPNADGHVSEATSKLINAYVVLKPDQASVDMKSLSITRVPFASDANEFGDADSTVGALNVSSEVSLDSAFYSTAQTAADHRTTANTKALLWKRAIAVTDTQLEVKSLDALYLSLRLTANTEPVAHSITYGVVLEFSKHSE